MELTTTITTKWDPGDVLVGGEGDNSGGWTILDVKYDDGKVWYLLRLTFDDYWYTENALIDWGYVKQEDPPKLMESEKYEFVVDTPVTDALGRLDLLVEITALVDQYRNREGWSILSNPTYSPSY